MKSSVGSWNGKKNWTFSVTVGLPCGHSLHCRTQQEVWCCLLGWDACGKGYWLLVGSLSGGSPALALGAQEGIGSRHNAHPFRQVYQALEFNREFCIVCMV